MWIRHFWANSQKKKRGGRKKPPLPTPHPPPASWLIPLGSLLQNRADSCPVHNGKLASKSAIGESTGDAFFVKHRKIHMLEQKPLYLHSKQQEKWCVCSSHIFSHLQKHLLCTYFNYDLLYSLLKPGLNKINFQALAPMRGKTYSVRGIPAVCLCW